MTINSKHKKILDLGCGDRKKHVLGAQIIGIDKISLPGVDVIHNLNQFPYPFSDNYFDEIIADDVIEHLDDVIKIMEELWRIAKPEALIKISVPHFSSDNYFTDISHKHPFSSRSFNFFDKVFNKKIHNFYTSAKFSIIKKIIGFSEILPSGRKHFLNIHQFLGIQLIVNKFPRIYEKFFAFIIPATELYFELKVVKDSEKIKILVINPTSILAGGTVISNNLINGLNKNQFEIFCYFPEKGKATEQIKNNAKIILFPKLNLFSASKFLRNFIKKNKINIIHVHGTRAAVWGRLAIIGLKNPPRIIYTLHGFHIIRRNFFISWISIILERILNFWVDTLVCVSEADKKLVLKYKVILPKKIKIIKNGINLEKFQIDQNKIQNIKKELRLEKKFILCSISRLHRQKDIPTILMALKLIILQIKNIKLLIVGDGPLQEYLEKEVKNLNLKQYVEFLGFQEDTQSFINLSDILILSTKWEGLPLTPLEVGACKKPIIASDIEGVRETIIDGKTGILFKPTLEKDLANKILKLAESKELREIIGKNAFKFVSENFDQKIMVEKYKKLYLNLYENSSS
ncbi:MAG: glycosyltransferase [Patescibacteria group bacterium]|nr:glycosyltransferase [Patescibacteria group bacterium]MBU1160255.1 glycosyltransferase [Patescibacteria group bacterium]MBU1987580.1 glycosyltransferase [Patescibacteria group bacterium]MBU2474820.1 glycosyltransferase [Patescibacteria group bacterium]